MSVSLLVNLGFSTIYGNLAGCIFSPAIDDVCHTNWSKSGMKTALIAVSFFLSYGAGFLAERVLPETMLAFPLLISSRLVIHSAFSSLFLVAELIAIVTYLTLSDRDNWAY